MIIFFKTLQVALFGEEKTVIKNHEIQPEQDTILLESDTVNKSVETNAIASQNIKAQGTNLGNSDTTYIS